MAIVRYKRLKEDLIKNTTLELESPVAYATESSSDIGTAAVALAANFATSAGNAGTAFKATSAGNAGTSLLATSAGNAGTAFLATSSANAGTSGFATSATLSGTSYYAGTAQHAYGTGGTILT